jgi:hypothetical protein
MTNSSPSAEPATAYAAPSSFITPAASLSRATDAAASSAAATSSSHQVAATSDAASSADRADSTATAASSRHDAAEMSPASHSLATPAAGLSAAASTAGAASSLPATTLGAPHTESSGPLACLPPELLLLLVDSLDADSYLALAQTCGHLRRAFRKPIFLKHIVACPSSDKPRPWERRVSDPLVSLPYLGHAMHRRSRTVLVGAAHLEARQARHLHPAPLLGPRARL